MPATQRSVHDVDPVTEHFAIHKYLDHMKAQVDLTWKPFFKKWARLRIPTGQIVRTAWKECDWEANNRYVRRARMVKVCDMYVKTSVSLTLHWTS